jgi:hypothetical protein
LEDLSDPLDQKVHRERSGKQSSSSWYQSARLITVQGGCFRRADYSIRTAMIGGGGCSVLTEFLD